MDGYCLTVGNSFYPAGKSYKINDIGRLLQEKLRTVVPARIQLFQDALQYVKEQAAVRAANKAEVIDFPDTKEDTNEMASRLLDQYGNMILRLAYSYLHNQSDAEDILQETLIKYLQTAPDFAGPVHEKAWLLKVAANLSKNRIDYNRIRQTTGRPSICFTTRAVLRQKSPGSWTGRKAVSVRICGGDGSN